MLKNDTPITTKKHDRLNRTSFTDCLAKALLEYDSQESICIGLYGPWGSGKTSIINCVKESIEAKSKDTVVFQFNPWLCQDSKQLISEFFKQFAEALRLKNATGKKDSTVNSLETFSWMFTAAGSVPFVGSSFSGIGAKLSSAASNARKYVENNLHKVKNEIVKQLKASSDKRVVIIDDIDRLSSEEIIAVFTLVKSLADFPNTIYLLAFDYDVVVKALEKVQSGSGIDYLNKIVQIPFAIPEAEQYSVQQILFSRLDELIDNLPPEKWDRETWGLLFQNGVNEYIHSVRDVNRFTNTLALKLSLIKDETNVADLMGLTCLQVFEPFIYSQLFGLKSVITGDIIEGYDYSKEEKERVKAAIDSIFSRSESIKNAQAATSILRVLFPKISYEHYWGAGRVYNEKAFYSTCSIANPNCFDRYFLLTLDRDSISTAIIDGILTLYNENQINEALNVINTEKKIPRLFTGIEHYLSTNPKAIDSDRSALLCRVLLSQYQQYTGYEGESYKTMPFSWSFLFCIMALLDNMTEPTQRTIMINTFIDDTMSLKTLTTLLWSLESSHGRFTEKGQPSEKQYVSLDELKDIERKFVARCILTIGNNEQLLQYDRIDFIWLLRKVDHESFKKCIDIMMKDDIGLTKLICAGVSHGRSYSNRTYNTFDFQEQGYDGLVSFDECYDRLLAFSSSAQFDSLSDVEKQDIAAFLLHCEDKKSGKSQNSRLPWCAEELVDERLARVGDMHKGL